MADEGRYFWMKLKADFFQSKRIKKLRKIAGGDTYTIIYLKMQLKSCNTGGVLRYTGLESTFAEELALDLDEDVDNVIVTLNYLKSCDLIETSDNIEFLLPYAVENIGSEGASAQRVREFRKRHKDEKMLQCNAPVTKVLRRDRDRDKEDIDIEVNAEVKTSAPKHKYGMYQNVLLTDEDLSKLKAEFGDWQDRIERLSEYIASSGKKYKSHLATIRSWSRKDKAAVKPQPKVNTFNNFPQRDYGDVNLEELLLKKK